MAPVKEDGKERMRNHFTTIDFDLGNVNKEAVWDGVIQADSQWCHVKTFSVKDAMRTVFKNLPAPVSKAKKLQEYVLEEFSEEKQKQKFLNASNLLMKKIAIPLKQVTGFSFCIPTNGKRFEKTLLTIESIKKQKWGNIPHEIIVCGNIEPFKDIKDVILIDKKDESFSRKVAILRNEAAKASKYEEIVFCDDDVLLDKSWLTGVVEFSNKEGWNVLSNKVLNPDGTRYWDRSTLNPHVLVDYEHPKEDKSLYQSSAFFLVRKNVFDKVKWDETKLVYADREGGIPEDVQYSFDLIENGFLFSFNKNSLVWHNDDSYTEFSNAISSQTLKKELLKEKMNFEFFLPEDEQFLNLIKELKNV
jgi:hypothetical protein